MVKRNQRWIALALGATLTVSFGGVSKAWAAPNDNNIQTQRKLLHSDKAKLSDLKNKEADALSQLDALKKEVQKAVDKMDQVKSSQKKTQAKIDQLKKEIQKTQERINKRKTLLEKRVRIMYENGSSTQFLDVLLKSDSFSDFISRAYALHLIAQQDHNLLEAQKEDKKKQETDKKKIESELKKLQDQWDSLKSTKKQLHQKVAHENNLLNSLKSKDSSIQGRVQSEMHHIQSMQSTVNSSVTQYSSSVPSHFTGGAASGSISSMIQASKHWIGNSIYVFGGGRTQAQIQNGVFDCSSFVHWAYSQIGVNVGWTTGSLSQEGSAVSPSSMRPGDLVFFNTYEHNGHVGIYIGGGQFIGAQSSSGVSIASLSNPYWSAHFSGTVRRIVH